MNVLKAYMVCFLAAGLCGCEGSSKREMVMDDYIVSGTITNDTVFDGRIFYFEKASGRKVSELNYNHGIRHGEQIQYYSNGKVKLLSNYTDGKKNGPTLIFDSLGSLEFSTNNYFDFRVGPTIEYRSNRPYKYYYYSLDNKVLFEINYDSIKGKKITDLQHNFFFYNIAEKSTYLDSNVKNGNECFLYLMRPPKYNFRYCLVLTDENYGVKKIVHTFSDPIWERVNLLPVKQDSVELYYAIELTITDSTNDLRNVMYKILPTPY